MTISKTDLDALAARLSTGLAQHSAKIILSVHFSVDRVNDVRNKPPITIQELEDVFIRFIAQHIGNVLTLNDNDTFNIRCVRSHINMPCALRKYSTNPKHKLIVITIMRHPTFYAKDLYDFHVV